MLSRWPCARRGSGTSASAVSREANGTVATSTKLEGRLYRSVTSGPPPLTPRVGGSGRYGRTEWPCHSHSDARMVVVAELGKDGLWVLVSLIGHLLAELVALAELLADNLDN